MRALVMTLSCYGTLEIVCVLLLLLLLFLASYIIDQWTLQCEWAKPEVTTKADV